MKQTTLGSTDWTLKSKVTRRAKFLTEMDGVIPWPRLLAVIEPHFPKAEQGRPLHPLPRMLRIYFMHCGSTCPTRQWRTRCTTASRCAGLQGST